MENEKLPSVINSIKCLFMKPRALNIPYSYVFPSTSASISEKTSILASMDKKMIVVKKVELKKSLMIAVSLNWETSGVAIV